MTISMMITMKLRVIFRLYLFLEANMIMITLWNSHYFSLGFIHNVLDN